ncbi:hypothetical protein [Natronobacterium gregoryi]|uniref:Uncharacterized protein n=1 Tax=Natronobacterium gregoryi (strain ATCC 43098 / DSM 3393 / CCM 3738 / CIP 104747 / IAM 13177 / JCM 8860 / NBRC 102187 / NCIMB 2189 / SP2) TaxID=797304 RepID=L9Y7Z0_NATGS|nr:hypothetical protein [Natronobacterium gregoryi]ELY69013.1 hypothetical protein C490_08481 [Natronobacterium gregoryi SP2]
MELGIVAGVIVIGFVHGVLPDHGWPIAAMYALNRSRHLLYGLLAALILGVGHLISSVVLVLAYYWFSTFAEFAEGPWMRYLAGTLLILLGIHEYRNGSHTHLHENGHDKREDDDHHAHTDDDHHAHTDDDHHAHTDDDHHAHTDDDHHAHTDDDHHAHTDDDHHAHTDGGILERTRSVLPGGGGHEHLDEEHAERGLAALGLTALLLGFAHEEPIQILAICVGTEACLELMLLYSLAVIVAIVVPTLLLIAGYERHRERVERITPYLPTITAIVLVGMGLAFISGLV